MSTLPQFLLAYADPAPGLDYLSRCECRFVHVTLQDADRLVLPAVKAEQTDGIQLLVYCPVIDFQ